MAVAAGFLGSRRRRAAAGAAAAPFLTLLLATAAPVRAQDGPPEAAAAAAPEPTPTPAPLPPPPPASVPKVVGDALWNELKRYGSDTAALVVAPFHWDAQDGWRAAGAAVVIGGAFASDRAVYDAFARNRSDFTDSVSRYTTWFGAGGGFAVAAGLIGVGLVSDSDDVRDMGRDALEASIIAGLFTNVVIKPTAGRWRPSESDGETKFDPFSGHNSFTSGHATQAFAVASVIAMRAPGWIIPTIAYGLATVVACDRINDRAHFASDVVTAALFATATGRFLVHRHRQEGVLATEPPRTAVEVVPIPDGAALRLRW